MRLLTLGDLSLENSTFQRVKPLLLLTYLALEGPKERRHLAELFWSRASDPMNSLSAALTKLRKVVGDAIGADEVRVWTGIETDVRRFSATFVAGDLDAAITLYRGPFLRDLRLPDWNVELEEWVYATREELAGRVRRTLLKVAERDAARGRFADATQTAEAAHALHGAPEYEPEELTRLYLILQAGESPLVARVRDEARTFDLDLSRSGSEARGLLQRILIGRERESARLTQIAPGDWAWLRGGSGMGKTVLLRSLPGTYLVGRSGLPYATLEPLIGSALQEGEATVLQHLLRLEGRWLFDSWEHMDEQSQKMLLRLRELRPRASVVVASREPPPFPVDVRLELRGIPEEALNEDAWERTHGLPALVEAYLRNEPLEAALEARLAALSSEAHDLYITLALLDEPDIALTRQALGFGAAATAGALEELLSAGLAEPSGRVRVRRAAQEYLETRPATLGPISLRLARVLSNLEAFPLFKRSRHLWSEDDAPKAAEAYLVWSGELLRRGFPQQTFEVLENAPQSKAVVLLKTRALERAGRYQEAFEVAKELAQTPEVSALRSTLLWRLGKPEEAREAATSALSGSMAARAEAQNTLGHLDRSTGIYEDALKRFRRAAALWLGLGERSRWASALINIAIVKGELGSGEDAAFEEALEAADDNLVERARVFLNKGLMYERRRAYADAETMYKTTIKITEEVIAYDLLGKAWNNLGHVFELQSRLGEAREAYGRALQISQSAGERFLTGVALANLAELDEDADAWGEAMRIFEETGHHALAERYKTSLPPDHPVRRQSEQKM